MHSSEHVCEQISNKTTPVLFAVSSVSPGRRLCPWRFWGCSSPFQWPPASDPAGGSQFLVLEAPEQRRAAQERSISDPIDTRRQTKRCWVCFTHLVSQINVTVHSSSEQLQLRFSLQVGEYHISLKSMKPHIGSCCLWRQQNPPKQTDHQRLQWISLCRWLVSGCILCVPLETSSGRQCHSRGRPHCEL